jgi:hypothetical protein
MIDFTGFFIKGPRVPSVNSVTTFPPKSSGNVVFKNAFSLTYTGTGSAFLQINSNNLITVIENDIGHPNALNLDLSGAEGTISSLVQSITGNSDYSITGYNSALDEKPSFLKGIEKIDISSSFQVEYFEEKEFLTEAGGTGEFGSVSVNITELPFEYSRTEQKWIREGAFDIIGEPVPSDGKVNLSDSGASLEFKENPNDNDLTNLLTVTDSVSLESAAEGQFDLVLSPLKTIQPGQQFFKNGVAIDEGVDYLIDKVQGIMSFVEPRNLVLADPIPDNFRIAQIIGSENLGLGMVIGEYIRDINGNITGITYSIETTVDSIALVPDTEVVYGIAGEVKGQLTGNGLINFIELKNSFSPTELILHPEEALFADDFKVFRNGVLMEFDSEYRLDPESGFLSLTTPAFPGEVFTINYRTKEQGEITNELLGISKTASEIAEDSSSNVKDLGSKPSLTSTIAGPYEIEVGTSDLFSVSVNTLVSNIFLTPGSSVSVETIINDINDSANGFTAIETDAGTINLIANSGGPDVTLTVGTGNANSVLGFINNDSAAGTGAEGGERSLQVRSFPIVTTSFSAPSGGDVIIIKNANVISNYPSNSVAQIGQDFYIIKESSLDNVPNLVSTIEGPFNISLDFNHRMRIKVDGTSYTITLTTGSEQTVLDIVDDINLVAPGTAEVVNLNNRDLIKIKGSTEVEIENIENSAYNTLGLIPNSKDTSIPDTIIQIDGLFVQDYQNPDFKATRASVNFVNQAASHQKASPGVGTVVFESNIVGEAVVNMLMKVETIDPSSSQITFNLYKVIGVTLLDTGFTEINLGSNLVFPLRETDTISFSSKPLLDKFTTEFFLSPLPYLGIYPPDQDTRFDLTFNGTLKERGTDYSVDESGKVTLQTFELDGSSLELNYVARKELPAGSVAETRYVIFKSLEKDDEITGTYTFINPDQFYLKIVREKTLAERLMKELEDEIQRLNNPSSSGVSTESPSTKANNDDGGNTTPDFEVKEPAEKAVIAKKYFDFYNNRIILVEDVLKFIKGSNPGGDDGKIVGADIDSAVSNLTSRFFPATAIIDDINVDPTKGVIGGENDDPYQENDPLNLPVLRGLSQNDDGSSASVNHENETNALGIEKQAFLDLLLVPHTSSPPSTISVRSVQANNLLGNYQFGTGIPPLGTPFFTSIKIAVDTDFITTTTSPQLVELNFDVDSVTEIGPDINEVINAINAEFPGVASKIGSNVIQLTANASIRIDNDTKNNFVQFSDRSNFFGVTIVDTEFSPLSYEEYAYRQNHSQQFFRQKALDIQRTVKDFYLTTAESLQYDDLSKFSDIQTFINTELDKLETDLSDAETNEANIDNLYLTGSRYNLIDNRLNSASSEITRLSAIEDFYSNLLDSNFNTLRYIWLVKLINKVEGFLQQEKRIIKDQAEKERKKEQNQSLL